MTNQAISIAILLALKTFAIQLLAVEVEYEWDRSSGKSVRTDKISGCRYHCFVDDMDMEKIQIVTPEMNPGIDPRVLAKAKQEGKKVYVTFTELAVNSYVKDKVNVVNASAEKVNIKNS